MQEAFRLGGWGMYPTTFFGIVLLACAFLYATRPDEGRKRIVGHLSKLVLLSGVLGFITGVIKSFIAVSEMSAPDAGKVALVGVGESLNNVGLSLVLLIMTTLITLVGVVRGRNDKSELIDPRG